jgi:cytidylate kinase
MNTIITIARQYGSGGREIGELLARELAIPYYDKELLKRAAKESGMCEDIFENHDEKPTNSFLYSLVMDTYSFGYTSAAFSDMPINQKVFLAQFNTIKSIANEGPCVIVGRLADYALEEYDNCFSVFVHADTNKRMQRVAARNDITIEKAKERIQKTDKRRASYYDYYSNKKWGAAESYNLSLDSGSLGIEGAVYLIQEAIAWKEKH